MGYCTSKGYGQFNIAPGHPRRAHRLAWTLTHGDPGRAWVLHECDNPPCCNPGDLFLGNHAINMADRKRKGRYEGAAAHLAGQSGEENPRSVLTADLVELLRDRYAAGGMRQVDLAQEFGISQSQVSNIIRGVQW